VIGRCGRRLLAGEAGQSLIVIGPTQSQKTSGIAIPAILEWQGPVIATSVKSDLVRDTIAWRRRCGSVVVYDPTASTGLAGAAWSPLTAAGSWQGARRVASALCSVARSGAHGGMEDAGFWYSMAEKLLAPLLFAASTAGASMADVCRWVDTAEVTDVLLALELAGVAEAVRAARASFEREDRQRSSVYATVESVLEAFSDPAVLDSAAAAGAGGGGCEVRPEALVGGGSDTLYVCAPAHEQERLQPVFVAVVRQVLEAALERAAAAGRPLDPPLLVVLDEAANVAPVADLDRLASTAAGHGVQLVTVFQDMAQIESRYGARSGTVVNNHRAKVVLSGISDPATLEHMSRLAGEEELWMPATTIDADGRRSRTESASTRALAPAAWLRRIAPGTGVLVYGHLPPARIELRPWFRDPVLNSRAKCSASDEVTSR
jgi:type IV secretion system protein VirD4